MNNRLELLIRKNRGRKLQEKCKRLLVTSGYTDNDLALIELDAADRINSTLKEFYDMKSLKYELLSGQNTRFELSSLLMEVFDSLSNNSKSYIYTYDCKDCGMFLIDSRKAITHILELAKNDYEHTCYLIDQNFRYSFTITYNDELQVSEPNTFDIQLWKIPD